MLKAYVELVKCRMREFVREPSAFYFVLSTPVVLMLILGYGLDSSRTPEYRVGIAALPVEMHPYEHSILSAFSPAKKTTSVGPGAMKAEEQKADASTFVLSAKPLADLTQDLAHQRIQLLIDLTDPSKIRFVYDQSAPLSSNTAMMAENIVQKKLGRGDPVAIEHENLASQGSRRYVDFLIPGLICFSGLFTSLFGLGMTLVAFRRDRLFKRLATTPLSFLALFASFITGRYLIFAAEIAVILLCGALFFQFAVQGSLFAFLLIAFLGVSVTAAMAVLLGSRLSNTGGYNGMVNLLALPLILLSGLYFSREHLPHWLGQVWQWTPLAAWVDALRLIALDGASLPQAWPQILCLGLWGLVFSGLAKLSFRWY
jgi:ABC-2 type transport system permease protein